MSKQPQSSDFALRDILERWAGSDETLKIVMMSKAEEDRLKQEVMRLEIRRTELEMLKEAIRSGIQPSLIPQLFSSGNMHSGAIYTPVSPTQAQQPGAGSRTHFVPPQPIPAFAKGAAQSSPRVLPKIDTSDIATGSISIQTTANGASGAPHQADARQVTTSNGEAQPNVSTGGQESDTNGLFFHHWQPPSAHQGGPLSQMDQGSRAPIMEGPGSPTPRKRKLPQYHILNPSMNTSPSPQSRRSPARGGHVRHRSEASALSNRYGDQYLPPVTSNNIGQSRMSHDRESPVPVPLLQSQNPTSHEIDLARKRKRSEQETAASEAASAIPEEPASRSREQGRA